MDHQKSVGKAGGAGDFKKCKIDARLFFEHVIRWKSFFSLLGHIYFFGQNPQEYYFVINNSWGNFSLKSIKKSRTFRNVPSGEERERDGCIRRLSLVENIGVFNLVPRSHSVLREILYDEQEAAQPQWGWGTTYNGIYAGGGSARKGYLFQASGIMYERVGISLVEVYERVRKSVTSVCKKN